VEDETTGKGTKLKSFSKFQGAHTWLAATVTTVLSLDGGQIRWWLDWLGLGGQKITHITIHVQGSWSKHVTFAPKSRAAIKNSQSQPQVCSKLSGININIANVSVIRWDFMGALRARSASVLT